MFVPLGVAGVVYGLADPGQGLRCRASRTKHWGVCEVGVAERRKGGREKRGGGAVYIGMAGKGIRDKARVQRERNRVTERVRGRGRKKERERGRARDREQTER